MSRTRPPVLLSHVSLRAIAITGLMLAALAPGLVGCTEAGDGQIRRGRSSAKVNPAVAARQKAERAQAEAERQTGSLLEKSRAVFTTNLPTRSDTATPASAEQIALGRMLFYDQRLSKGQDLSCNSCHDLSAYGIDVREPEGHREVSKGHRGVLGTRNAPSVYNAGLHFRLLWDGRAENLAHQARMPILNPEEMAMPSEEVVLEVLASIPGYARAFRAAFPEDPEPVNVDNMAAALAGFEAGLVTPSRFDYFLSGQRDALTEQEQRGLATFIRVGCTTCHMGPTVGGNQYQKLGLVKTYQSKDKGRFEVTGAVADTYIFKVPSLRNVAETAPYLHDGSVGTLDEMVALMGEYQLDISMSPEEIVDIVAFLESLTGLLPSEYIQPPRLPPSSRQTPKPDNS
ncbi:cytochrome-c peroxidase [Haliangium sp.]|uniref:cytochrome-c peroxidase n=1 Tax=Haliangium sp. TaxID=2663208 RepID=UPI003D10A39F